LELVGGIRKSPRIASLCFSASLFFRLSAPHETLLDPTFPSNQHQPSATSQTNRLKVSAVEAVEKFLFTDFPTRETFTTKDYEKDAMQTTPEGGGKCFIVHQNI
jgi:hypothetical protein